MEKKKKPIIGIGNLVFIPVGETGSVYDNAALLASLINKWSIDNPNKKISGTPNFITVPASGTRKATIDCIFFMWN